MAEPLGADDWIVPGQAGKPASAPSTGGADDWITPPAGPLTLQQHIERAKNFVEPPPVSRVETAIEQGEEQGFGNEPLGLSPEHVAELQKTGLVHTPGQPFQIPQAITDFGIRYGAKAADALFRAVSAGVQGVASGAGQVAREFGQNEAQARKLTGDVGTLEELAIMSPIPEIGLLDAAAPPVKLSTPEEIAAFNAASRAAPGYQPPPPSPIRADIDEFLRQRAAREAAQGETPQLPPPTEAVSAPAEAQPQPAPPQPEAPVAPAVAGAEEYPSFEERGRAPPPAAADDWIVPEQAQPPAAPAAQIPETAPPKPQEPPNLGPATLQAVLNDPRTADEIRTDIAAEKGREEAVAAHGAQEAQTARPQIAPEVKSGNAAVSAQPLAPTTPAAPLELQHPADVYAGAEHTATPTPGQAEAGNYVKRHVKWNGLGITIETEAGGVRTGTGPTGQPWSVTLTSPYGYIKRTTGADSEQVDLYLGPQPQSPHVYIVDQIHPETGGFDEHKAFIGYPDEASARAAYLQAFSDGSGDARLGSISGLTVDEFKSWLKTSPKTPLAYSDPVRAAGDAANALGLNPTEAAVDAAGHTIKVSGADPTHAIFTAVEQHALVDSDIAVQNAKDEGLGDAWTSHAATESAAGEGPAPAGERPAEAESAVPSEAPPARVEPHAVEPDRGAAEPVKKPVHENPKLRAGRMQSMGRKAFADGLPATPPASFWTSGATLEDAENWARGWHAANAAEPVPGVTAPVTRDEAPAEPAPIEPELEPWSSERAGFAPTTASLTAIAKSEMSDAVRAKLRKSVDKLIKKMATDGKRIADHCLQSGGKFSVRS